MAISHLFRCYLGVLTLLHWITTASTETTERILLRRPTALSLYINFSSCFNLFTSLYYTNRLYLQLHLVTFKHQFVRLCSNFLARILEMAVKRHRFYIHCVSFNFFTGNLLTSQLLALLVSSVLTVSGKVLRYWNCNLGDKSFRSIILVY